MLCATASFFTPIIVHCFIIPLYWHHKLSPYFSLSLPHNTLQFHPNQYLPSLHVQVPLAISLLPIIISSLSTMNDMTSSACSMPLLSHECLLLILLAMINCRITIYPKLWTENQQCASMRTTLIIIIFLLMIMYHYNYN